MLDLLDGADQTQNANRISHLIEDSRTLRKCASALPCTTMRCSILHEAGKLKAFSKDEVIFWDGETDKSVYLIVSGIVRGAKLLCDGRRQVTRFTFPGELLGYGRIERMSFTAEAITSVNAYVISRQVLDDVMHTTPCIQRLIIQSILEELHETQCRVTALARLTARERIAQFLHNICTRSSLDGEGAFHLPMPRQDIADHLGLTIETVSRVFSKLKRENRIHLLPSSRVRIPNPSIFADELLANAA